MNKLLIIVILVNILACSGHGLKPAITTITLLNEMDDLQRLKSVPDYNYRTVQYSSYDRRSTGPNDSCWFSNEDGFGNEPIAAFEKVLEEPDTSGTGKYLICDVKATGAIVRLWTAGLNGRIRLFLDDVDTPVYDGNAQDLFWKTVEVLSGKENRPEYSGMFRQYDASYFPIVFSGRCRMEWIGDIRKIHFYHVGLRIFNSGVKAETFRPADIEKYHEKLDEVNKILKDPGYGFDSKDPDNELLNASIPANGKKEIFRRKGTSAITLFSLKVASDDMENVLRKSILSIYFDDSSIPQVQAPIGDFFGSAPGINPYQSLPFSVLADSTMICRFNMPYRHSVHIEIENFSDKNIKITGAIKIADRKWLEGKTMHFRARWKIDHGLTTSTFDAGNNKVQDIIYLMASGTGRIVGTAAYIYNPSNATTSWGNWWGEGDEKIFVDSDTFPSFFGTGSEDYFNYSWSSAKIFSYPYCGQPRNDGPGNRGYVSDFRWHISDDIPFRDKIAFYMELGHHGVVNNFSYGRIVYFYALPGTIDDYRNVSMKDISDITYPEWKPLAYLGSAGFRFIQAEKIIEDCPSIKVEKGKLWAEENIVMWRPVKAGDKIKFRINTGEAVKKTKIGVTLSHNPSGGNISFLINGKMVKFDESETVSLFEPFQTILATHFSETIDLKKGVNEVIIESKDSVIGKKTGVDFFWLKDH